MKNDIEVEILKFKIIALEIQIANRDFHIEMLKESIESKRKIINEFLSSK